MLRNRFLACTIWVTLAAGILETAEAGTPAHSYRMARRRAATLSWHDRYYNTQYGAPVALVVPPTAEYQTDWAWGVSGTRITPIYHQFGRRYPGYGAGGGGFMPTPIWPSDTDQFGVHHVRGPW